MLIHANPKRFMDLSGRLLPYFSGVAGFLLVLGLYLALFVAPKDYQQSETVRIMFVHVPAALMTTFVYAFMAVASIVGLAWKHPVADMAAKAAAPIGACFAVLMLATGALWGQPMWGTWWVWDARLTSALVQLFLYIGYIALWEAIDEPTRAARAAAILAIVGVINIPIIKFSVEWWNTLHQPASLAKLDGPSIDPSFLWPLLIMMAGYVMFFATLVLLRTRTEILNRRMRSLHMAQVRVGEQVKSYG